MKKITTVLSIFLLLISIISCNGIYENGKEIAKVANKTISQLSVDSFQVMMERGDEFLIIDVREANEFAKGNIDYSTNIPRGIIEFKIQDNDFWDEQGIYAPLKEDMIIIYSQKGDRGTLATFTLMKLGFTNVSNISGGFDAYNPDHEASAVVEEEGGYGG
jgi:rhodanese-related sulfurtransferase